MENSKYEVLLCLMFFTTAIIGNDFCYNECNSSSGQQSLYEQYCCRPSNRGETIKIKEGNFHYFIVCPQEIPGFCKTDEYLSCSDILAYDLNAASGYYNINLTDYESTVSVYCDMEGVNCDGEGGWTRIGYLDMTKPDATCPDGLTQQQYNGIGHPLCGRSNSSLYGCDSASYSSFGLNYTKVCGQVRGYQYGHTDAFTTGTNDINSYYVDGVSITQGLPRQHVWTYAAGNGENSYHCPCSDSSSEPIPAFVGSDYYCESGPLATDPLWDGEQCNDSEATCCDDQAMPWFYRELEESNEDIELRVCSNLHRSEEEIPIDIFEIFVK